MLGITGASLIRVAILTTFGVGVVLEPYVTGRQSKFSKGVSAKNTGIRKAATSFLEKHTGTGDIWDSVKIADLRKVSHLTSPHDIAVIDGAVGKNYLKSNPNAHVGVAQDERDKFVHENISPEVSTFLLLFLPYDATKATANNGAAILHELIHHAEFRAGYFDTKDYYVDEGLQERNTAYFDKSLLDIGEINELITGPFRGSNTEFTPDDSKDLLALSELFIHLMRLENGEATYEDAGKKESHRMPPDLAFLKRDFGCDMSIMKIYTDLIAGKYGDRAKVATLAIGPLLGLEHKHWQDRAEIVAFANLHFKKHAERVAHIRDATKRAISKHSKEIDQERHWLIESLQIPVPPR